MYSLTLSFSQLSFALNNEYAVWSVGGEECVCVEGVEGRWEHTQIEKRRDTLI